MRVSALVVTSVLISYVREAAGAEFGARLVEIHFQMKGF